MILHFELFVPYCFCWGVCLIHPPKVISERRQVVAGGTDRPIYETAYYMPKIKDLNLQGFYLEVLVKMAVFVAP